MIAVIIISTKRSSSILYFRIFEKYPLLVNTDMTQLKSVTRSVEKNQLFFSSIKQLLFLHSGSYVFEQKIKILVSEYLE